VTSRYRFQQDYGRYLKKNQPKFTKILRGVINRPIQILARFREIIDEYSDNFDDILVIFKQIRSKFDKNTEEVNTTKLRQKAKRGFDRKN
jgi:hypothetical protein